jgi:hypothetical protein
MAFVFDCYILHHHSHVFAVHHGHPLCMDFYFSSCFILGCVQCEPPLLADGAAQTAPRYGFGTHSVYTKVTENSSVFDKSGLFREGHIIAI